MQDMGTDFSGPMLSDETQADSITLKLDCWQEANSRSQRPRVRPHF